MFSHLVTIGETGSPAIFSRWVVHNGEYWYLLGTDGVWYVSEGDMTWKKVADLVLA